MVNTMTTINVKQLILQLIDHKNEQVTIEELADMCVLLNPPPSPNIDWLGIAPKRYSVIKAPTIPYSTTRSNGKPTVVRDYFRALADCEPNDEVLVEIQPGLQLAAVQKNVRSFLDTVPNHKWNSVSTAKASNGVLVKFQ